LKIENDLKNLKLSISKAEKKLKLSKYLSDDIEEKELNSTKDKKEYSNTKKVEK